jgi:four helix bundle protein
VTVRNYRERLAWQKAIDFVELVYNATRRFPREEISGFASQVRRGAVSIQSSIAEGQGRQTTRDFVRFLSMAHGSFREVETQIINAERLQYVDDACAAELMGHTAEVGRQINGLANSLTRNPPRS